VKTFTFKETH